MLQKTRQTHELRDNTDFLDIFDYNILIYIIMSEEINNNNKQKMQIPRIPGTKILN